ncbi:MAG: AgmX/PglI C-terminal domain-containing protein [Polyangiaceae bacterium]
MNKSLSVVFGASVLAVSLVGCSTPELSSDTETSDVADVAPRSAPAAESVEATRVAVERTLRELDRGGDPHATRVALEALLADPAIGADDRTAALLGLSRALEAEGDLDGAATAVETVLMSPDAREHGATRDAAERQLRRLLTGHENETVPSLGNGEPTAKVAHLLSKYFPADATGRTLVDICVFGEHGHLESGIWDIADAKRLEGEASVGSDQRVGQSISSSGSWIALPRMMGEQAADMPQPDRSMVVFFYDLGDNKVPARYDAYLPIPSAEIEAALEQGNGLVAIREREAGKPLVVIAAPREAQFATVHAVFADLAELPTEPILVPLEKKLLPGEIQAVVRSEFGALRKCYSEARTRDASLEGKLELSFSIDGEGVVTTAALGEGSTLTEATLASCALDMVKRLHFPASGASEPTKVTYPVVMTP